MKQKTLPLLLAVLFGSSLFTLAADTSKPPAGRERLSLDRGWRFHLGDVPFPVIQGHGDTYHNAKAGKAWGAAAPEFDDAEWRQLNLPHDWVIEQPFDQNANLSQGYRLRGVGWYRRQFRLDPADRGRHLELQFDGVATHCTVWFNGTVVHRNWCGYTSFYIDITPFAQFGDHANTVVVRVDANPMEGWWYEGAGIYRHTWLVKRSPVHIITDGVFANPVRDAKGRWSLPVEATLDNSGRDAASVEVAVTLTDPDGRIVAQGCTKASVKPLGQNVAKLTLPVESPRLWSVDEPTLYRVHTVVTREGAPVDEVTTTCGFRTLRFDADKGFFLNDKPLKLKGVCNHQDHAGVGAAMPDSLWEFRLRKMKEMGANAHRCSHNPPAAEFLDACDRLGVLVMDENRNFNCAPEYMRQLEWMLRRDRNHPSVILWSVFNEEPMQGTEVGYEMVRRMAAVVKRFDTTRPVTAAMNGGFFSPVNVSQAVDVAGFNYQIKDYDKFHAANPKLPLTSSEDTSAFQSRGEFVTDKTRNLMNCYDTEAAPWGATHRNAWRAIAERPFLAGGFIWTGFDYHGEPTPFTWPSVSSVFGCADLCGFPKPAFYLHQAQWIENRPVLHLIPHWNWPGREGQPVKVMALSNADTVALSLNGKLLGEKPVDKYEMVEWEVPYAAGRLEAVAKKNAAVVARAAVETAGAPVALQLLPDRPSLAGDGEDAQPVTVRALDAEGRAVPTANLPVEFTLTGPGGVIGLGNGDANCHEPEKGNRRSLYNGLAQVIVQTKHGASGALVLCAKAADLKPAEVEIKITAAPARPFVPMPPPVFALTKWRMSPVAATVPDPNQQLADNDMNSWAPVQPGKLQPFAEGKWAVFRTRFQPPAAVETSGGRIVFKKITGKAAVWLDNKLLGRKEKMASGPLTVKLPPRKGEATLSVLIEGKRGQQAGFGGAVIVEAVR
ncbi:MAG: glycoside hydrolase family 2 protein [Verrucomicrobia bacterium]|nr:glycoside hydrolase family 2 protein [Verrucomicrobiota bacterium]